MIRNLESANQKAQEWVDDLVETGHFDKEQQAYGALRSVLHCLRDRLTPEQAAHLSAQLPMVIRGIYYEAYRPSEVPHDYDSKEAFLNGVRDKLYDVRGINAERAATAVFELLHEKIDAGEIAKIQGELPDDINGLWPAHVTPVAAFR